MSSGNKKIIYIVIGVVVLFLVFRILNSKYHFDTYLNGKRGQHTSKKLDNGQTNLLPFSTSTPLNLPEPGRALTDYSPNVPPGLPVGLPIEKNPLDVIYSYVETYTGDQKLNEKPHSQITYAYVTTNSAKAVGDAFVKYFTADGYKIIKNYKSSPVPLYTINAVDKSKAGVSINFSATVYNEKLNQQIITVSEIAP